MKKILLALLAALISLPLYAETPKPLALRGVMQGLSQHMQTLTGAIAREDWALVAKTAPLIAAHAQPNAAEHTRINAFLGANKDRFQTLDHKTHEAAHALLHAAQHKDGTAVISAFHAVQTGCYDCHREFRKPFVSHFYGKR
jgi:cytochrome c556